MINIKPATFERKGHIASLFVDEHIASGKYSVYHGEAPAHNTQYAVKVFPKDTKSLQQYSREQDFLQATEHQNIIGYIAGTDITCDNDNYKGLILEFAPYGDLFQLVISEMFAEERLIRMYFHQFFAGVEYLHLRGIAHLDLKLENLLIGRDYVLKITDFDQAQDKNDTAYISNGTGGYRAPEILSKTCKNIFAADIFSMGMTLYAMVSKRMIFDEKERNGKKVFVDTHGFYQRPGDFWTKISHDIKNPILKNGDFRSLINGMLAMNPEDRLTLSQIKESKWFRGRVYNKKDMEKKMKKIFEKIHTHDPVSSSNKTIDDNTKYLKEQRHASP